MPKKPAKPRKPAAAKRPPGRPPERLKLTLPFEEAVAKSFEKPPKKAGE